MRLDIETVITQVRRQFKLFSLIVAAAFALSVVIALISRPVYRGEAVVTSAGEDSALGGLGGIAGQLGGLASLAGGLMGGGKNWNKAIAVLHSRHLIEELVTQEHLLPVLFPKPRFRLPWAKEAGTGRAPTMGDAVLAFQRRILQIREDPKTSLVTVRIDWFDAQAAADWANELVAIADREERAHAVNDAQTALTALQREFALTESVELRGAIAHLIEEQLKARTVAGVRAQFAYRLIDRAVPADPDKRVQPTRTTMVIAGTLAGILLGVLIVLFRFQRERRRLSGPDVPG